MSGFADVDAAAEPGQFADYLRAVNQLDGIASGKRERVAMLGLRPGGRAIDVGCGLGDDARALARIVGPSGHVVGVDASRALLTRARGASEGEQLPVEFVIGDAHRLPFEAGTFDAARTERTLQHLADPARAVRELARVTRPGGVVMAIEPDWGTAVLSGKPPELVRALLAAAEARIRNAWVGRELPALLLDAGVERVAVGAETLVVREHDAMRALIDVPSLVADAAALDEAEGLLADWAADASTGRAIGAITLFTAFGPMA